MAHLPDQSHVDPSDAWNEDGDYGHTEISRAAGHAAAGDEVASGLRPPPPGPAFQNPGAMHGEPRSIIS